jgi:dihydropteroate synthase
VLNVTPDSFSDGGLYLDAGAAIARGVQMAEEGASVIDVGAESTRPGATRIDQETEIARLEPVVRGLVLEGIRVSVDTMRAEAAMRMVDCGAAIINDVTRWTPSPTTATSSPTS